MNGISRTLAALVLISQAWSLSGRPLGRLSSRAEPDPSFAVTVEVGGKAYVNKGLVAFGLIPSNFTESTGDTLGGIGSAIALKRGSFSQSSDGSFTGTIVAQPDRGFNVDGTIDYQARQHQIDFVLSPYYDDDNLSFDDGLETLKLTYRDTLLYTERESRKTTGLDALGVRPADSDPNSSITEDPPVPIAPANGHISFDDEGLALNADGTFWVSDEYGPYIYLLSAEGQLIETVQPPEAILPLVDCQLNFTSATDPDTGRSANQGFEGLTLDASGQTLYALLQSATIQDGGDDKTTSRYTRLLAYNITDALNVRPTLIGEYVVPLPQSKNKGKTRAASELHFVSEGVFLVLSRDSDGHGGDDAKSSYKQADLLDISQATDIHGTKFDDPSHPIAKKGKLDKSITPGTYVSFVNFIDDTQLARFGVHNGKPVDQTLIDAKWESLALAPVLDPDFPDDYFLFTAADNDYITTQGIALGQPYDAGLDNDNQFLVFRVTLPGAAVDGIASS
ncbi:esterase-like activity of phytase-domain-containing protein [Trametes elegans]|nr:esterase-like activity of phytase-domain-containing protein [Trametes elegans]